MSANRKCVLCGTDYEYCPTCERFAGYPRWMFLFHDENCKKIYEVLNNYGAGAIDKNEAKSELSKLDLSKKNQFNSNFKDLVNEIYGYTAPVKKTSDSDKD